MLVWGKWNNNDGGSPDSRFRGKRVAELTFAIGRNSNPIARPGRVLWIFRDKVKHSVFLGKTSGIREFEVSLSHGLSLTINDLALDQ